MGFHHVDKDGLDLLTSWSTRLGLPKCWDYRLESARPAILLYTSYFAVQLLQCFIMLLSFLALDYSVLLYHSEIHFYLCSQFYFCCFSHLSLNLVLIASFLVFSILLLILFVFVGLSTFNLWGCWSLNRFCFSPLLLSLLTVWPLFCRAAAVC